MACVAACWRQALQVAGRYYTVDELMRLLHRDQDFWGRGGGVTLTGGEPLLQKDFLLALLRRCRSACMHTALETSAHADPDLVLQVGQWVDWLFIDVKHMNSAAHRQETGVGNELILKNLAALVAAGRPERLVVRVPLVPGFNDSAANLEATAELVAGPGLSEVNLLPFHRLGSSKYEQLGLEYHYASRAAPSSEELLRAGQAFFRHGLRCYLGGETPF
jgi:pyruvate formate lyase activating enzyme